MERQCLNRLENGVKPSLNHHKCPDYGCPVEAPWPEAPNSKVNVGINSNGSKIPLKTVLVIGGAGFLGRHIIFNLADSIPELQIIRVLDRQILPSGFKVPSSILNPKVSIEFVRGDIRDKREVREAFRCVDAVIHVASIIAVGPDQDEQYTYSTNIRGTKNVLELLKEFSIKILVYTSSALCTRTWDEVDNESEQEWERDQHDLKKLVFPVYGTSKIVAESLIRKACLEKGELRAISLRPSAIYGEGDYLYVPSMILAAKNNRGVMVKLGAGKRPIIQRIYAGNCAWAHVHVLRCLARAENLNHVNGHAFHIADDTPTMPNEEFSQPFLKANGCRLSGIKMPYWMICFALIILGLVLRLVSPIIKLKPPVDKNELYVYCTSAVYKTEKIEKWFGYKPRFSYQIAKTRSMTYYGHVANNRDYISKARKRAHLPLEQ